MPVNAFLCLRIRDVDMQRVGDFDIRGQMHSDR